MVGGYTVQGGEFNRTESTIFRPKVFEELGRPAVIKDNVDYKRSDKRFVSK